MSSLTTAGSAEEHSVSVEEFGTHLSLGIGGGYGGGSSRPPQQGRRPRTVHLFGQVLSLQDYDEHDGARHREPTAPSGRKKRDHGARGCVTARQNKKARTFQGGGDGGAGGRKKLRLTGAQAAMLEDSFRANNILSHAEKQELARRVGLSARQVEVWFQNRRARTKLKQTEVDCKLLRRWCDRLTDENARLQRDLAELRASARHAVSAPCCDKQVAVVVARAGEIIWRDGITTDAKQGIQRAPLTTVRAWSPRQKEVEATAHQP